MFHNYPEVRFIPCHIEDDRFHVHPDQIFQNNGSDKVCRTASRVASVVGAYKVILPLLKVIGGAVPHFCSAVGTVNHAGKQTALARFRPAVALLPDLLHLVKDFLLDNAKCAEIGKAARGAAPCSERSDAKQPGRLKSGLSASQSAHTGLAPVWKCAL